MSDDIYSMTKAGFHEAIRQAKEQAWDEGYNAGIDWPNQDNPHRKPS